MKRFLFAAGLLAAAQPAQSHCYSVWRYPTSQRCGVSPRPIVVVTPPTIDEDTAHERAIERLRIELNALLITD